MACDSLFGSDDDEDDSPQDIGVSGLAQNASASLSEVSAVEGKISILSNGSSIPGLYLFPGILPFELQEELLRSIVTDQIVTLSHPQAMLFPRASTGRDIDAAPRFLEPMLKILPGLLKDRLSPEDYAIVFDEKLPMQTIVNLYEPGQGITPHVCLLKAAYMMYKHCSLTFGLCGARSISHTAMHTPSLAYLSFRQQ